MRKLLTALVLAGAGVAALGATADTASAGGGYRWYRDYAPLYPQVYYGPPVVYVVPPAYAYYPRPQIYPRQRYVRPYYVGRRGRCCY